MESHSALQNGNLLPSMELTLNGDACPPGGLSSVLQPNGHAASTEEPSSSVIQSATRRRGDDYQSILKLDVKRIQLRWDDDVGEYVARDEEPRKKPTKEDGEPSVLSVVRRFVPTQRTGFHNVVEEVHLHSPAMIESMKVVMKGNRSINWRAEPLKFEPNDLLAHMPFLKHHLQFLLAKPIPWDEELEEQVDHLEFLIEFLDKEYRERLQELDSLKAAGQVTFSWIWGVFIPGSILFTRCPVTGDPCAVRLVSLEVVEPNMSNPRHYALTCDYVNIQSCLPGLTTQTIKIPQFNGAKRIRDLNAYPFDLVTDRDEQRAHLIQRGKRHWGLVSENWRHMRYDSIAYRWDSRLERYRKLQVKSRFIIDQEMYDSHCPDHWSPAHDHDLDGGEKNDESRTSLTEEDYLIFSARLYGYSLSDRLWLQFRVGEAQEISWNPDIFNTLELSRETTHMVRALIESQSREDLKFDDFVHGKGRGLIFNLHGPPGVGKTLTAEATSEVTRSPLYMIGAGDLGTNAEDLDTAFTKIASLAERWKAVVLIDEADVFLEKRESQDIKRNAMVAVFLRHLEYWLGILFLTTNRVQVFDEAMTSRIHVSLTYEALSLEARARLWSAFLTKAEFPGQLTAAQAEFLRALPLNGREIKNVVKVATTLAAHRKGALVYEDVVQALKVLNGTQQQDGASLSSLLTPWTSANRTIVPFALMASLLAFGVGRYLSSHPKEP